jgi:hypothetical protein
MTDCTTEQQSARAPIADEFTKSIATIKIETDFTLMRGKFKDIYHAILTKPVDKDIISFMLKKQNSAHVQAIIKEGVGLGYTRFKCILGKYAGNKYDDCIYQEDAKKHLLLLDVKAFCRSRALKDKGDYYKLTSDDFEHCVNAPSGIDVRLESFQDMALAVAEGKEGSSMKEGAKRVSTLMQRLNITDELDEMKVASLNSVFVEYEDYVSLQMSKLAKVVLLLNVLVSQGVYMKLEDESALSIEDRKAVVARLAEVNRHAANMSALLKQLADHFMTWVRTGDISRLDTFLKQNFIDDASSSSMIGGGGGVFGVLMSSIASVFSKTREAFLKTCLVMKSIIDKAMMVLECGIMVAVVLMLYAGAIYTIVQGIPMVPQIIFITLIIPASIIMVKTCKEDSDNLQAYIKDQKELTQLKQQCQLQQCDQTQFQQLLMYCAMNACAEHKKEDMQRIIDLIDPQGSPSYSDADVQFIQRYAYVPNPKKFKNCQGFFDALGDKYKKPTNTSVYSEHINKVYEGIFALKYKYNPYLIAVISLKFWILDKRLGDKRLETLKHLTTHNEECPIDVFQKIDIEYSKLAKEGGNKVVII